MMRRWLLPLLFCFAAPFSFAQITFPSTVPNQLATAIVPPVGAALVQPPADLVGQLQASDRHTIQLPSSAGMLTLDVHRFSVITPDTRVLSVSHGGETEIAVPDHVLLRGSVKGASDSWVFLAVFETHVVGIIEFDQPEGRRRLMIAPDTVIAGRMAAAIVHNAAPNTERGERCRAEELPDYQQRADSVLAMFDEPTRIDKSGAGANGSTVLALQLALECDSTFYARHNSSLAFAAQYAITLAGACSAIYQRDANVALQVPFLRIWTITDPYVGTINERLTNIRTYWNANMQHVNRAVTCLLSGSGGGGLAWVGVLCGGFGYNVSGVSGSVNFPATGYIWDVDVTSHELGHNIGSPHSHNCSWNPPLDSCWYAEGGCYDHVLPQRGSIMSYCHLQYTGNALRFHPRVASLFNRVMENNPCVAPVADVLDTDVAVVDIRMVPTGGFVAVGTPFTPQAVVRNTGRTAVTGVQVTARLTNLQNDTLWTSQRSPSIPRGGVAVVNFAPTSIADSGTYLLECTAVALQDQHPRNDRMTRPFLVAQPPSASITVVWPIGGERLTAGDTVGIRYAADGVDRVHAELSADGGVTWTTQRARTDVSDEPIAWVVPPTPTEQALVRVTSLEDGAVRGMSPAPFTIRLPRDAQAVDVVAPAVNATVNSPLTPRVVVRNNGAEDLTNVVVRLTMRWVRMSALAYDQQDTIQRLTAGAEDTLTLPESTLLADGVHVMDLQVIADGDANAENDHFVRQFTAIGIAPPQHLWLEHGPQRVIVRWDAGNLRTGDLVELWRGSSSADMTLLKTLRPTVDTWVDAPLSDGRAYTYALRTRRGSDASVFTDLKVATPTTYPSGQEPWVPQTLGPAMSAVDVAVPLQLVWTSVPGADRYEVQMATDRNMTDLRYVYVTSSTDALAVPAVNGQTWWWRVRAINETYNGGWSAPASFSTTESCAGTALAFNGTDARATNTALQWDGGPITVEWWQYVAAGDVKNASVFAIGEADNQRNRLQAHSPWGNGRIYWDYGAIGDSGRVDGRYPGYDQWVHVALVSDGATFMRIYTNGEVNAERTGAMQATGLKGITIGSQQQANWFKGKVDEFRIWSVARTQEQIQRTMRRGQPLAADRVGLFAEWRMNETAGTVAADGGGKGLALTLNTTTEWASSEAAVNCVPPSDLPSVQVTRPGTQPAETVHRYAFAWQPVEGAEWYEIEVYPTDSVSGPWLHRARNVKATNITLRGLPAATTCAWRVRAMSTQGVGPWTTAWIVTPEPCASQALVFAGNGDHVVSPDLVFDGRATTVEYWALVATEDVGNRSSFSIGEADDAERRFQAHAPWRDNKLFFDHGDYRNGGRLETAYDNALDRWTHVALTSNGINDMHLYLDGREVARSSFGSTPGLLRTMAIGANPFGGFRFKGRMSDVRVWNVMKSEEQIREGMYERIVGGRSHMLGNWPLDDGEGSVTEDISGAQRDAAVTGSATLTWEPDTTRTMMQVPPALRGPYVATKGDTVVYSLHPDQSDLVIFRARNGIIIDRPDERSVRVVWVDNTSMGELCVIRTFAGGCADSACFDIPLRDPVSVFETDVKGAVASVHPNPTSGEATLRWTVGATAIEVRDVLGRMVCYHAVSDADHQLVLDGSQWSAGRYHIRVVSQHQVFTLPLEITR